jgi:hypothetical protein
VLTNRRLLVFRQAPLNTGKGGQQSTWFLSAGFGAELHALLLPGVIPLNAIFLAGCGSFPSASTPTYLMLNAAQRKFEFTFVTK